MNCHNSTVIVFFKKYNYSLCSESEVFASNTMKCGGADTTVMHTDLLRSVSNKPYIISYFCLCFQGFLLDPKSYTSLINES